MQEELGSNIVAFEVVDEDHLSMVFSKDMTYFKRVLDLMEEHIE